MAKLSSFRRDMTQALDSGEWVAVGMAYDDLEIKVRGYTDAYWDNRNAATRALAMRKYRGDASQITMAEGRTIMVRAIIETTLMDVRNLEDDETGQPMTLASFASKLLEPNYSELLDAVNIACSNVGRARAADAEADVKNS